MAFSHHRASRLVQSLWELFDTLRRQIQEHLLRWRGRCRCIGLGQSSQRWKVTFAPQEKWPAGPFSRHMVLCFKLFQLLATPTSRTITSNTMHELSFFVSRNPLRAKPCLCLCSFGPVLIKLPHDRPVLFLRCFSRGTWYRCGLVTECHWNIWNMMVDVVDSFKEYWVERRSSSGRSVNPNDQITTWNKNQTSLG